jgi:hypothetical protein
LHAISTVPESLHVAGTALTLATLQLGSGERNQDRSSAPHAYVSESAGIGDVETGWCLPAVRRQAAMSFGVAAGLIFVIPVATDRAIGSVRVRPFEVRRKEM